MKKEKTNNPNLEANKLIEPMVFFDNNGKALVPGMDLYDRPLDSKFTLPEIEPLGMEYFIDAPKRENTQQIIIPNVAYHDIPRIKDNGAPNTSDTENAYAIKEFFLSKVNLIVIKEKFYLYSGRCYQKKTQNDIERQIVAVCRNNIKNKPPKFVNSVADYIIKEPQVYFLEEDLPKKYISLRNGVLDIEKEEFFNHSPNFLTLYEINADYLGLNVYHTPVFDKFLMDITGGDFDLVERILQIIGYIISPDFKAKCLFLFQGVGNSGKSVLTNVIIKLFNSEAFLPLDIKSFSGKFTTSNLVNIALCTVPDLPAGVVDDVVISKLKQFTGNDITSSDVKFGEQIAFLCSSKFLLATNHAFLTKTKDEAFENRVVVVPFKYTIKKEHQDFNLESKLLNEKDGIVTKAIAAYFRLKQNGYIFAGNYVLNETVSDMVSETFDFETAIFTFLNNNYVSEEKGIVFIDDAYQMFLNHFAFIHKNIFSEYFTKFAEGKLGATKVRKRRSSKGNPLSALRGILLKA